ncbi:MAG: hypothetical protein AAB669_00595 [Patescibacteria group bacterium]
MHFRHLGFLTAILFAIIVIGCGSNKTAATSPSSTSANQAKVPIAPSVPDLVVDTPEFNVIRQDRMAKLDKVMKAAFRVVKKLQDKEAIKVWDFMAKNGRPAIIAGSMHVIGDQAPAEHPFYLIVVTADDARRGEPWSDIWYERNEVIARHVKFADREAVVLPDVSVSDFARTLVFVHELRHAWSHATTVVPDTVDGTLNEELPAYSLQDRLARKLAGKPFETMLGKEVDNLSAQLTSVGASGAESAIPMLHYEFKSADMPKAFPGLCQPGDEQFCFSMFNRLAIQEALDRTQSKSDALRLKKRILEILLRHAGLIPENAK